jgi:tetratricopeptide (TPR) repeat protein
MSKQEPYLSWPVTALAVVYILLCFLLIDSPTMWGVNHLSYLDWDIRLVLLAAAIVIPLVVLVISQRLEEWPDVKKSTVLRLLVWIAIPIVLLTIFYFLRMRTHYLGDGVLRAREIEAGIWFLPTEPLAVMTNSQFYILTSKLFGFNPAQAIELISFISGLLYYFAAVLLVRYLFMSTVDRLTAALLLLFSGTTLLFCGYVETYSLLPAGITLFFLLGMKSLDDRCWPGWPLLLFVVLVAFHFANLYLIPAVLCAAIIFYRDGNRGWSLAAGLAAVIAVAMAAIVPRLSEHGTLGLGGFLIDFSAGENGYWLLSTLHLTDVLNQLLLTAPAFLILLPATIARLVRKRALNDRRISFVLLALPGALAMLLLLDPKLGYASDWDLFSPVGLLLVISTLTIIAACGFRLNLLARVAMTAAGVFAFLTYATVNADFDKSIDRQVDILALYGERGGIGYETMGNDLNAKGHQELAEEMWREALKLIPHRRTYNNLGQLLLSWDRVNEAIYYFNKGIELDSTYAPLHVGLGNAYRKQGKMEAAEHHYQQAIEFMPEEPAGHYNLAMCLAEQGKLVEATEAARRALELAPRKSVYNLTLGTLLARQGKFKEAKDYLILAIRADDSNVTAYLNLAEILVLEKQPEAAEQILIQYLERNPSADRRPTVERLLVDLREMIDSIHAID